MDREGEVKKWVGIEEWKKQTHYQTKEEQRINKQYNLVLSIENNFRATYFFFKSALLIPTLSTLAFHPTHLFLFSLYYFLTNSVASFSPYKHIHNPQFLHSLRRRANARNVCFETLNGGQFTRSTQLIKLKLSCHTLSPSQHRSFFFENWPLLFLSANNKRWRHVVWIDLIFCLRKWDIHK